MADLWADRLVRQSAGHSAASMEIPSAELRAVSMVASLVIWMVALTVDLSAVAMAGLSAGVKAVCLAALLVGAWVDA